MLRDDLMKRAKTPYVGRDESGVSYAVGGGITDDLSYRAACAIDVTIASLMKMRRNAVRYFDLGAIKHLDDMIAVLNGR